MSKPDLLSTKLVHDTLIIIIVTLHAQMMETSKQVVRWEKCFF